MHFHMLSMIVTSSNFCFLTQYDSIPDFQVLFFSFSLLMLLTITATLHIGLQLL